MKPPGISQKEFDDFVELRRTEQFLMANRRPGSWLFYALNHKRGADALYEIAYAASQRDLVRFLAVRADKPTHSSRSGELEGQELQDMHDQMLLGEYLILIGYGFECLFKGHLIAKNPSLIVDDNSLHQDIRTHDLVKLCQKCGIDISDDERRLLQKITLYIYWGKYPSPLRLKDMPSGVAMDEEDKSRGISNAFYKRRIQVILNDLFSRARLLLEQQRTGSSSEASEGRG